MVSDSTIPALIVLALSLITFLFAFLSESCIISVQRERVQVLVSQEVKGSRELERLMLLPTGPTSALVLIEILAIIIAAASGETLALDLFNNNWWSIIPTIISILVLLGIIQVAAGVMTRLRGERFALQAAGPVFRITSALGPLTRLGPRMQGTITERFSRVSSFEQEQPSESGGETETEEGPLDEREVEMIRAVVDLDKTIAREIMLPRVDFVAVPLETSLRELGDLMTQSGHSRIPVYEGDLDHIIGIAYARDILRYLSQQSEYTVGLTRELVRPVLFIPEFKTLKELLEEFQQKRVHMAMVVDEYGGVSGLVTIEDLLEEIVGEIRDEFDVDESEIKAVGAGQFVVDARVAVGRIEELLGTRLEGEGFDTLGGLVYHRLGRIARPGDTVEYDRLRIEVLSTVGRRLKKLRLVYMPITETSPK